MAKSSEQSDSNVRIEKITRSDVRKATIRAVKAAQQSDMPITLTPGLRRTIIKGL